MAKSRQAWNYGVGLHSKDEAQDFRIRRDLFDITYSDSFVVGAFGAEAQLCKGDSGGPLGIFVTDPPKYAAMAVANRVQENDTICGFPNGATYWSNATTRIWYIETAIGKTCAVVNRPEGPTKECWH